MSYTITVTETVEFPRDTQSITSHPSGVSATQTELFRQTVQHFDLPSFVVSLNKPVRRKRKDAKA